MKDDFIGYPCEDCGENLITREGISACDSCELDFMYDSYNELLKAVTDKGLIMCEVHGKIGITLEER